VQAYPDALQTGMLGPLSPAGHTPDPDGWVPEPLVEDRLNFGLHAITSSPLMLAFNVSNDTLVEMLWNIIANEEAIHINQQWGGSPGRLVATIVPPAPPPPPPPAALLSTVDVATAVHDVKRWRSKSADGRFVVRRGQLGQVSGWGHNPKSAHGLTCPVDVDQLPGATPTCNLLRVATCTVADAQEWCAANADCAAFSFSGGNATTTTSGDGGLTDAIMVDSKVTKIKNTESEFVIYFKDSTSLFFMDSNFRARGQVQASGGGWMSYIKAEHAPPGFFRDAPCAGTTCPANSRPCHTACLSIAPCCSDHGPTGEALDFGDGVAQLWSKRLVDGSLALLFANLGKRPMTHTFTLDAVGMRLNSSVANVNVRNVWTHTTGSIPVAQGSGSITFDDVSGHDSRFVVLSAA
jgi:hypothetical protein